MTKIKSKVPALRFPEFKGEWDEKRLGKVLIKQVDPVDVDVDTYYSEIGIRSHGKGIFYKEPILGKDLGNKRVFWIKEEAFIVNIVFAWEQAVAKTTEKEKEMIASHRFPMYIPKKDTASVDYILHFFLTRKGKRLLELASPGGAGRNKTLGQKEFEKLSLILPLVSEQTKIANFLTTIDDQIQLLKLKKNKLEAYKRGVMQQIFSQKLRFKDEKGNYYDKWEEKKLGKICEINKGKQLNKDELFDEGVYPALNGGVGPSGYYSEWNTDANTITISEGGNSCGYVNYIKSRFWSGGHCYSLGNIKKNIYNSYLYQYLKYYQINIMRLRVGSGLPNIQKGDINGYKIEVPSLPEQQKIANFLCAIDDKITFCDDQITKSQKYKDALLQQMFV